MGQTVNHLPLRGNLEGILEGIGDIHYTNGEVVCGSNGKNHPQCGCCQYWRGGLVKVNGFHLRSTIGKMAWSEAVDVVTDLLDVWGYNRQEDAGCSG